MSAARARGGQLVVENVALLSGGSAAFQAKYKVSLSDDSFRVPGNTKVAFPLLHFLLTHISPSDAAAFKPCFPVLDREQERDFRKLCDSKLADLERQKLLPNTAGMRKSTISAAGGDKFEQLIWHLSTLALKQAALRHPAYSSSTANTSNNGVDPSPINNPNDPPGSSSSNRRYAALLRARIASERAAFARTTQMGRDSTARWTHEIEALKDRITTIANRTGEVKKNLKSMGYDPDKDSTPTVLKTSPIESDGSYDDNDHDNDLNALLPFTGHSGLGKQAEGVVNNFAKSTGRNHSPSSLGTVFNPSCPDSEAKSCANVAQLIEAAIESLEIATKRLNQQISADGDISDISRDTSLETVDTGAENTTNNKLTEQVEKSLSLHQAILESTNSLAETAKSTAQNKSYTQPKRSNSIQARINHFQPPSNRSLSHPIPSPNINTFAAAQDSTDIIGLARMTAASSNADNHNNSHPLKSPPPPAPAQSPSPQWITDATQESERANNPHAEYNEETEAMSWELMDVDTDPDTRHIKEEEDIDITHMDTKADFINTVHDLQKAQNAVNSAKGRPAINIPMVQVHTSHNTSGRKSALRKTSRSNFDPDVPFHRVATKSRRKKSGKMVRFAELPPSYTASKSAATHAAASSSSNSSSQAKSTSGSGSTYNSNTPNAQPQVHQTLTGAGAVAAAVRILDDHVSKTPEVASSSSPTIIRTSSGSKDDLTPSTHILTHSSSEDDDDREREVLSKKHSAGSSIVVDDDTPITRDEDYVPTGAKNAPPVSNTRLLRVKQPTRRNTPRHLASRRAIVIRNAISDRADSTVTTATNKVKNQKKGFVVVPRRDNNNKDNDADNKGKNIGNTTTSGSGNGNGNSGNNIIDRTRSLPGNRPVESHKTVKKVKSETKKTVEPSKKEISKQAKDRAKDMVPRKPTVIIMTNTQSSDTLSTLSDESDMTGAMNSAPDLGKLMAGGTGNDSTDNRAALSMDSADNNMSVVKVLSNELSPTLPNSLPKKMMKQRRHSMAHNHNANPKPARSSRGLRKKDKKEKSSPVIQQPLPDRKMAADPDSDLEEPQARRSISSPDYAPNIANNNNNKRQASGTGRLTSFTNMYGKHRKNRKNKNADNNNEDGDTDANKDANTNGASSSSRRRSLAGDDGPMFSWLNSGDKRASTHMGHTSTGVKRRETFHGRPSDAEEDMDAIERAESATEDVGNNLQRKNSSIFSGSRRSSVFSRNRDGNGNGNGNNGGLPFFRKDRDRTSSGNKPSRVKALRDRIAALL